MTELTSSISECNYSTYLVLGTVLLVTICIARRKKRHNFPPGPRGLPFFGYALFLGDHAAETLRKLKSKYGPVMSLPLGMEDWVVLNDYDAIHQCLVKQGDRFSGRPKNAVWDMLTDERGIIFADYGNSWKHLRKFGLTTLRGFGFGKKGMEENVVEETPYLIDELTKDDGKSHAIKLNQAVSNIICRVTFGSRFEYDDEKFATLMRLFIEFFSSEFDAKMFGIIAAVPSLRYLPVFRGALQRCMKDYNLFLDILKNIMEEHQATFNKDDIRDFTDAFIVEMQRRGPGDESFNERQLLQYVRDLFEAGTGTTSSTLGWGLLALVNHPECQMRISEEIQKTIGESGIPSMKHRDEMNYTCAFIQELMRHRTLVPTNIMHKTSENAVINGYTIPKDTAIIPNIWAVHHDPDLFENPSVFKPERFLDENGTFVKSKHVIPFSIGPRHCLGEQLARMEIFIFLTGIMQKVKILPDPSNPPPPLSAGVFTFLATYEPPEFKVLFEKR